uniref:Protein DPCD n=1 Tax=Dunaliella tertiolecta TaxID=3047 RepID=A0A7S3QP37_DUNTE|mmetsp:Transcript_10400/g.27100  ORF Transcript_10400/g.27100 Transcript_10400/m.27100 type:complete len:195 (+) Transcript_10400:71-655(+)
MFRRGGSTTAIASQGRKKAHTTFPNGAELVEEYDQRTGLLLVRKRREKSTLGKDSPWEYLVGEAPLRWNAEQGLLKESSQNPIFVRQDVPGAFQWRIRNLPYPSDVFSVSVDPSDNKIVVRTSNKKYYKRWHIPEMELLKLPLSENALTFTHANNTLIVNYSKPGAVLQAEAVEAEELRKLRVQEEGDADCRQQ